MENDDDDDDADAAAAAADDDGDDLHDDENFLIYVGKLIQLRHDKYTFLQKYALNQQLCLQVYEYLRT